MPPLWKRISIDDGIALYRLESWDGFADLLRDAVGDATRFVWRGQRESAWSLSTSLDRLFSRLGRLGDGTARLEVLAEDHRDCFLRSALGRRGDNPRDLGPLDSWALGQHFGLASPLLDWSRSPYVGAYFAYEEPTATWKDGVGVDRAIYALDEKACVALSAAVNDSASAETGRLPVLEFYAPRSEENRRLVSQRGLFTRSPIGQTVEQWVRAACAGNTAREVLLKVELPAGERERALRALDLMNVNHLSLFPDLLGASRYANLITELRGGQDR